MSGILHPDVISAINKVAASPLGRKYDRAMRKRYGKSGVAVAAKTVLGEFGNRSTKSGQGVVSSAGARGPAQFIRSTRDAYMKQYGIDPWASDTQAIQGMMRHHLNTGIEGYNPGMPTYKDYIMGQRIDPGVNRQLRRRGGGGARPSAGAPGATPGSVTVDAPMGAPEYTTTPDISREQDRAEARRQLLTSGNISLKSLLRYKQAMGGLEDVPGTSTLKPPKSGSITVSPGPGAKQPRSRHSGEVPLGGGPAKAGGFKVTGPNPGRLQPEVRSFARKVSRIAGQAFEGPDGSTHSKYTTSGRVSEHSTGNAVDIFKIDGKPAQGDALLRAGRAALIAAGMPRAQALKSKGGLYNVGNHQIIFLTNEGGNHFDHLHISARGGHRA